VFFINSFRFQAQPHVRFDRFSAMAASSARRLPRSPIGKPQAIPGRDSSEAVKFFKDEVMRKYQLLSTMVALALVGALTATARAQQVQTSTQADSPEYVRLVERLGQLGEMIVKSDKPEELLSLSLAQADALEHIVALSRLEERDGWVRQLAQSLLSAATQSPKEDVRAINRMATLRASVDRSAPQSTLAAFVAYQQLQIEHARLFDGAADNAAAQHTWRRLLAEYINAYPRSSETNKSLVELASLSEVAGKDEDARRCYRFMLENQPQNADLEKAAGALNRLNLTGQELHLALPLLKADSSSDEPFDIASLRGKIVLVYFWSAKNEHAIQDMRQIAGLLVTAGGQHCQLVCVNCDADGTQAVKLESTQPIAGIQLHQRNGLMSHRLGLFELPQMILVGKDGCVINKSIEMDGIQKQVAAHVDDSVPEVSKPSSRMSTSRWLTIGK
jgi:hypothetical protein